MDWIHCNKCFTQLQPGVSLFLTSCGHMFCQTCLDSGAKGGQCKICQSQCTTMKLAPDMTPDVQDYFSEPVELLNKFSTILDFQRKHRMRLTNHWINTAKTLVIAKEEVKRLSALSHKLNDVVKQLQQKNRNLKAQLNENRITRKVISPFEPVMSPRMNVISPTFAQHPTGPVKSTPYQNIYQSSLVTPARVSKHRPKSGAVQRTASQRTNSSGVFLTPSPPTSAGSGYYTCSSHVSQSSPDMHASIIGKFKRNK